MDTVVRRVLPDLSQEIIRLNKWLITVGLSSMPFEQIVEQLAERLNAAGLRLARFHVSTSTLHPMVRAYGFTWDGHNGLVAAASFAHSDIPGDGWRKSPFAYMLSNNKDRLRRHLTGPQAQLDFPVLEEFRDQGLTDWYSAAFSYGMGADLDELGTIGLICSASTDRPDGFTDADITMLDQVLPVMALAFKGTATFQISHTLLTTYLGADPAQRVLRGAVQRGSVQSLEAVLFYADLRGFTQLADSTPIADLVSMLDDYLECMAGPVERRGGEVLKFLGDGLLATFGLGDKRRSDVCRTALDAGAEALESVVALNEARAAAGKPTMKLDLALHLGEVMYGNVGTNQRLDFTVVGPAVNEAARIEALCKELGRNLLISQNFQAAATQCRHRLISVGRHQLRGVRDTTELFTIGDAFSMPIQN